MIDNFCLFASSTSLSLCSNVAGVVGCHVDVLRTNVTVCCSLVGFKTFNVEQGQM
jgi:hypothetical protein